MSLEILASHVEQHRGHTPARDYAIRNLFNPLNGVIDCWQSEVDRQQAVEQIKAQKNGVNKLLDTLSGDKDVDFATIHLAWVLTRDYIHALIHSQPHP